MALALTLGIGMIGVSTLAEVAESSNSEASATQERTWVYRETLGAEDLESWLRYGSADTPSSERESEIEQLVLVRTLAREAVRLGLDHRPEVRIALEQARGRLAVQALRRHVSESIEISDDLVDAEVRTMVREMARTMARERFGTDALPRRVRLRNLFKRYPARVSAEQRAVLRQEMERLRQLVLEGGDFAELAKAESDSHTRLRGGLIGNVRPGTLRPAIDRVAMQLEAGEVSPVLEEPEGLTLLYCERILERRRVPDDVKRDDAQRRLKHREWRRAWSAMETHLLERADATWRWRVLEQPVDGSVVLVEVLGDRLTVDEVRALVAPRRSLAELASLDRSRIKARAEPFFRTLMANREVVALGLDDEALVERSRWTRSKLLAGQAIAEHVARRLDPVSDAEADALARTEPWRFDRPEHVRLAVIALPFDAADPRPAYALAEQLELALGSPAATFGELARRYSADPSAVDGGELPARPRIGLAGRLGIDAARAVRDMVEPGDRSGWVRDDDRSLLWWIELRDVEPARLMTPDEAREPASRLIGQGRVEQLEAAFLAEWIERLDLRPIEPSD
ncbi:MAG: peptidylprolyl isomerase [Acidobacteriota bacterium]